MKSSDTEMRSLSVLLKVKQHGEGYNVDMFMRFFSITEQGLLFTLRLLQEMAQAQALERSQALVQTMVQTIVLRQELRQELRQRMRLAQGREMRLELGREMGREMELLLGQWLRLLFGLRLFQGQEMEPGLGRKLGLHLMTLLPEDCGAEMGVIYRRIKKANASPWAIRLRLIEEFTILLWGFVQVKIDNLRLPRSNRSIDD